MPVATSSETGHKLEQLRSSNENITVTGEPEEFDILPGEITDTSFIPKSVQNECDNGYRWLSRVKETGKLLHQNLESK